MQLLGSVTGNISLSYPYDDVVVDDDDDANLALLRKASRRTLYIVHYVPIVDDIMLLCPSNNGQSVVYHPPNCPKRAPSHRTSAQRRQSNTLNLDASGCRLPDRHTPVH